MKNNLQEVLDKQGRKQIWLAKQLGVNRNTIANWIAGTPPNLEIAYQVAKTLNVNLFEIWPFE